MSIIGGVIAGDLARKLSRELSNTDREITNHIERGELNEAMKKADQTTMEHIYTIVLDILSQNENAQSEEMKMQFRKEAETHYELSDSVKQKQYM